MAMTDEHKEALALGRKQSAAIKAYLEALGTKRPGRPVTPETLLGRISDLEDKIAAEVAVLKRLDLIQRRIDAEQALKAAATIPNVDALEADFVKHAAGYSERRSIAYSAWRELGVPARVLRQAGINRAG